MGFPFGFLCLSNVYSFPLDPAAASKRPQYVVEDDNSLCFVIWKGKWHWLRGASEQVQSAVRTVFLNPPLAGLCARKVCRQSLSI